MTEMLFLMDSYLREFEATVEKIDGNRIILDKTAFYPRGGGQPCDFGKLIIGDKVYEVVDARKEGSDVIHELSENINNIHNKVKGIINWERRYKLMRMHTAAHILDVILYNEAHALCTGNQLGTDKSRIDFSLEIIDKEKIQNYFYMANEIVKRGLDVKIYNMKREAALKIPGIIKLAGATPPDVEELRIVEVPGIDIQADGGTQVSNTREIGEILLLSIENKGKNNRRVYYNIEH